MAIRLVDIYPNRTGSANSDYPHGSIVNESSPDAGDGTPLEKQWGNDVVGFLQAMIEAAGITPDNSPDTAVDSQYLDSLLTATRGLVEVDVGGSSDVPLTAYDQLVAMVRLTGTLSADIAIEVPDTARHYVFLNETSGNYTVTVKTGSGAGIEVRRGNPQWLYSDGTDVRRVANVPDQTYAGDPNGNLAADALYERAWDTAQDPPTLYIATAADGTASGTVWTRFEYIIRDQVLPVTSNTNITKDRHGRLVVVDASGGVKDMNLDAPSTVGQGFKTTIKKADASTNPVRINTAGSETIDGHAEFHLARQNDFVTLRSDGSEWHVEASQLAPVVTVYDSPGSHTHNIIPGRDRIKVEAVGGGGGGGSSQASGETAAAGGGGGAGYARGVLDVLGIASGSVEVGSGGSGGASSSGPNDGNSGTASSWSDGTNNVSATGGDGGKGQGDASNITQAIGGTGGSGSGGGVVGGGSAGGWGLSIGSNVSGTGGSGASGSGGPSSLGGGARGLTTTNSGRSGLQYGGGGSGACSQSTSTNNQGGGGANGVVIVTE